MEGLAKNADIVLGTPEVKPETHEGLVGVVSGKRIHSEIYNYFNLNPAEYKDNEQLKTINSWASKGVGNLGEALQKISNLEVKLGQPTDGTRLSKLYNWIRVSENINSLMGEMESKVGSIKGRFKAELEKLKLTHQEKTEKISEEIKKAEIDLKEAEKNLRLNANNTAQKIKKDYEYRLQELKDMQKAYSRRK